MENILKLDYLKFLLLRRQANILFEKEPLKDNKKLTSLECRNQSGVYKTYMRYFYWRANILEPINKALRKIMRIDYQQRILILSKTRNTA